MKTLGEILIFIGVLFALGTAGAEDLTAISFSQGTTQLIYSFVLIGVGVVLCQLKKFSKTK